MSRIGALVSLVAMTVVPMVHARPQGSECVKVCPASDGGSMAGTLPSGVSFALIFNSMSNGTGTEGCATCSQCIGDIHLSFNGHATNWCMSYQTPTTVGGPVHLYSRSGVLKSDCEDPNPQSVVAFIHDCAQDPTSGVFAKTLLLLCGCQS
jgi:hypothetical protein